jgi:predicted 3-demethylubiquinone-9 3-methyltransferase (glyoxalase superfamily)
MRVLSSLPVIVGALIIPWAFARASGDAEDQGGAVTPSSKLVPCLWFADEAEEAMRHYGSIFPDAKVLSEMRAGAKGPLIAGRFQLAGQEIMALNGNRGQPFTDAVSILVQCESQAEIDDLWRKLTADGGQPGRCGWLKDRYGVSWQIVPRRLGELLGDPDPARAKRVAAALLEMGKLDIARLDRAREGR